MPRKRDKTPEELAKDNDKLRRRIEQLAYEQKLSEQSSAELIQALRNVVGPKYLRRIDKERKRLIYAPDQVRPTFDEEVSWPAIADRFRLTFEALAQRSITPVNFRDVVIRCREGRELREDAVDWWPLHEVESRIAELRGEQWTMRWESRKGRQQTAEMLWDERTNPQGVAAIWIFAFLHEWDREVFEFDIVRALQTVMYAAPRNCDTWHHAMKNVAPWTLINMLGSQLDVRTVYDVIEVVAANAALVMATHELLHFVASPSIAAAQEPVRPH
jgi:hypothetical protein